jgi:Outer membrane protein beta-barrel domain
MPQTRRTCLLLLLTGLLLVGVTSALAQSRNGKSAKTAPKRTSSHFNPTTRTFVVSPAAPTGATASLTNATPPPAPKPVGTAVSVMQRETYLDGKRPVYQQRTPVRFSAHLLPTLSWNSATGTGTLADYDGPLPGLQVSGGVSVDWYVFPYKTRFAFGTGLWYTTRRAGYVHPPSDKGGKSLYQLGYLQVPLTLKAFSETIIPGGRTYAQVGLTTDVKFSETALDPTDNVLYRRAGNVPQFNTVDGSLLLSAGYMRQIMKNNSLIISLQYQRGFTNASATANLTAHHNLLALGAGLSF